jgi:phytanoyl-CoA hydroxylase
MTIPDAELLGFDEALYLQRYQDVAEAVACGEWPSGYSHYCIVGRTEGRSGSHEVDETWYQKAYPKVRGEIDAGWAANARDHYLRVGRHRGYLPNKTAPRPNNAADFRSRFGGLWVDLANARDLIRGRLDLGAITPQQAALLCKWVHDGYVTIENAVPEEILDRALADVNKAYEGGFPSLRFNVHGVGRNLSWISPVQANPTKALDLHWFSTSVREAIFSDKVLEFLHLLFERRALATQTLTMWRGSAQDGHQDSAYVMYSLPMQFCASWIALEDVHEDSGELFYHVGGQRMAEYLYHGRYKSVAEARRLQPESDVADAMTEHVEFIKQKAYGMSLPTERFLAKRGDVLLWSADLPHGGSSISPVFTRKSIVTHYCPAEIVPFYFEDGRRNEIRRYEGKAYYSSGSYGGNSRDVSKPSANGPSAETG